MSAGVWKSSLFASVQAQRASIRPSLRGLRVISVAALALAVSYLSSQSPFFDLGDVGVCRVQLVKVHLVELVVELLAKLPGQVVVAENSSE